MSALFSLVAHSRVLLRPQNQADYHRLYRREGVRPYVVHQATDTDHHRREGVGSVAVEEERMMSTFRTIVIPDHARHHRGGGSDHTAIQGLLREHHLAGEVHQPGARPEGEDGVQATVLIVVTAGAGVGAGRGAAPEVEAGTGEDETFPCRGRR